MIFLSSKGIVEVQEALPSPDRRDCGYLGCDRSPAGAVIVEYPDEVRWVMACIRHLPMRMPPRTAPPPQCHHAWIQVLECSTRWTIRRRCEGCGEWSGSTANKKYRSRIQECSYGIPTDEQVAAWYHEALVDERAMLREMRRELDT